MGVEVDPSAVDVQWEEFKCSYGRQFDDNEETYRKEVFGKNLEIIEEHNQLFDAGESTYKMGVNKFADWTVEEFRAYLGPVELSPKSFKTHNFNFSQKSGDYVPEAFDWVEKGGVTGVKNQGSCGSSWAFGAVATMEGRYFAIEHNLRSFSEQEFVDCLYDGINCENERNKEDAFEYALSYGVALEDDYPYLGVDNQTCCLGEKQIIFTPTYYIQFPPLCDEDWLLWAISQYGPVAVTIDAGELQFYISGVFDTNDPCDIPDHTVAVVGYDVSAVVPYYLIKNSWGKDWGEKGFFRMKYGKNLCQIALRAGFIY